MVDKRKAKQVLYRALSEMKTEKDVKDFLTDLCTVKEVDQMAERLFAANLLMDGYTYEEVIKETGISSATLSRVSKCIRFGKGYTKYRQDQ